MCHYDITLIMTNEKVQEAASCSGRSKISQMGRGGGGVGTNTKGGAPTYYFFQFFPKTA